MADEIFDIPEPDETAIAAYFTYIEKNLITQN
jgi:hypothetical protein